MSNPIPVVKNGSISLHNSSNGQYYTQIQGVHTDSQPIVNGNNVYVAVKNNDGSVTNQVFDAKNGMYKHNLY